MVRLAVIGNGERAARHDAALGMLADVECRCRGTGPGSAVRSDHLLTRSDLDAIVSARHPGPR